MSTPTVIQACAALYGVVPGASFVSTINTELSSVFAGDEDALLNHYYELVFVVNNGNTSEEVAARIVANLGLTGEEATSETTRMAAELEATSVKERGAKVKELIDTFETSGSEAAVNFVALKSALVTAVADPTYQGIQGKNVVFSSLSVAQVELGTESSVTDTALTTSTTDDLPGSAGIDRFSAVVSSLNSENTLSPTDKIAGGEGSDQLSVSIKGDFAGFSTGSVAGVETLILNNVSAIDRSFDMTGVTGATAVRLGGSGGGVVNLTDAALGSTITVSSAANSSDATVTIGYATNATVGTSDEQSFVVSNVGAPAATTKKYLTLVSNGVENVSLDVVGANALKMTNDKAKALVVTGDGSLLIPANGLAASFKTVDASTGTGAITLTAAGVTNATSFKMGAGADSLTIVPGTDTTASALLSGGDGADTLVVGGGAITTQFDLSGFETIELGDRSGTLTFSAANSTGIEKIVATSLFDESASFSGLGSGGLTVQVKGANSNTDTLTVDNTGATVVAIDTPATGTTNASPSVNTVGVSVSQATQVDATVATAMSYGGTLTAAKATAVTLNSSGVLSSAVLDAATATSATITTSDTDTQTLKLTLPKAISLTVNAGSGFEMSAASNVGAVQTLNVTSGTSTKLVDLDADDLEALNVGTLNGSGSVKLAAVGSATLTYPVTLNATLGGNLELTTMTTKWQDISLDASGVTGTVTVGAISSTDGTKGGTVTVDVDGTAGAVSLDAVTGREVVLNATGALGGITYGGIISAGSAATLNLANLTDNNLATTTEHLQALGSSLTVNLLGGLGDDSLIIKATAATASTITVSGNLGLGTNLVRVEGTTKADSVNVSGLTVQSATLKGAHIELGAGNDTAIGSALDDTIVAGAGIDSLTGGGGNDVFLIGDSATAPTVTGVAGSKVFTFAGTSGDTPTASLSVITDFSAKDKVVLESTGANAAVLATNTAGSDAALPSAGNATLVRGSYTPASSSTNATFTASATGADFLYIVQDNDSFGSAVLAGYTYPASNTPIAGTASVSAVGSATAVEAGFTGLLGQA